MKFVKFLPLIFLLGACAAPGHLTTPSGRPEITVASSIKQAKHGTLGWLLAHDYYAKGDVDTNESSLTAEKDVTSGFWKLTPGNQTVDRIVFTYFAPDSASTTIYAKKSEITHRANTNGVVTPGYSELNSQEDYEDLQAMLTDIAATLPKAKKN